MTLMKSLLLGSAAGIVAVASAQAADLPTKKGAPAAEYVKICSITVNGKPVVGWTLPGSDTCFKLSGYVTAQIEGGNLKTGASTSYLTGIQTLSPTFSRPDFGFSTRLNFTGDAVSNTAYGPLTAHFEIQVEEGSGFDVVNSPGYINTAYVTWAGITAGKAPSFYSFTGGGPGWANFFSPDEQGFNQPDLMAYTASFGGGFSVTGAIQQAQSATNGIGGTGGAGFYNAGNFSGTQLPFPGTGANFSWNGVRWPDFVANIKLSQGWGTAQVSGVAHEVNVTSALTGAQQDKWGWGIDAGVSFNLPQFGAGDDILVTGSYTENAAWYSGLPDAMWGEDGAVNGNGQAMALFDTYANPDGFGWATPKAWSVQGEMDHHFSPQFSLSPLLGYGEVNWTGTDATSVVSNSTSWIAGVVGHWDPVTNLDFEIEVLYQDSHTDQPNGYSAINSGHPWVSQGDGFATRFEITRSW
jgi:hypothetical protein